MEVELRALKRLKGKGKEVDENEIKRLESEIKVREDFPKHEDNFKIIYLKGKHIKLYKHAENASIIGDTIGDPLKDTSGPSLNILIKLSSIISVVFGSFYVQTSFLIK